MSTPLTLSQGEYYFIATDVSGCESPSGVFTINCT